MSEAGETPKALGNENGVKTPFNTPLVILFKELKSTDLEWLRTLQTGKPTTMDEYLSQIIWYLHQRDVIELHVECTGRDEGGNLQFNFIPIYSRHDNFPSVNKWLINYSTLLGYMSLSEPGDMIRFRCALPNRSYIFRVIRRLDSGRYVDLYSEPRKELAKVPKFKRKKQPKRNRRERERSRSPRRGRERSRSPRRERPRSPRRARYDDTIRAPPVYYYPYHTRYGPYGAHPDPYVAHRDPYVAQYPRPSVEPYDPNFPTVDGSNHPSAPGWHFDPRQYGKN